MGDEQDEFFAARRAAFEQQFHSLPAVGSAAYWHCIETAGEGALPLEVLCRCLRERLNAGFAEVAKRVFTVLWLRIQPGVQVWARKIGEQSNDSKKLEMKDELEQECSIALWEELADREPTFLLEHFGSTLILIEKHVAQAVMEKAGLRQRRGVLKPRRTPRRNMKSIEESQNSEEDFSLVDSLADPTASISFDEIEFLNDLQMLLENMNPALRVVIYLRFLQELTPQEIAEELRLTDRAVRYRTEKALAQLRQWYSQEEEEQHG